MNPNSLDTYNRIKSNGLLKGRRLAVYECIYHWGPMTATEVYKRLNLETNNSGRFTELHEMDAIVPVSIKENSNGNPETVWQVTGNLPKEVRKEAARTILIAKTLVCMQKLAKHLTEAEKAVLRQAYQITNNLNK